MPLVGCVWGGDVCVRFALDLKSKTSSLANYGILDFVPSLSSAVHHKAKESVPSLWVS